MPLLTATSDVLISTIGALAGVLVGGILNWTIQRRTEERREAHLALAAARLVSRDLRGADAALAATGADAWIWRRARRLDTNAWDNYREPLAVRLSPEQWQAAAEAVEVTRALGVRLDALLGGRSTTERLSNDMQAYVADVRSSLQLALVELEAVSATPVRVGAR